MEDFEKIDRKIIKYETINEVVDRLFPEYVNNTQYYDAENRNLQYVHLGNLASMIFDDLDNKKDSILATRLIKFANFIINNDFSHKLKELFAIEVFENMCGSKRGAQLAKEYLNGEALDWFHGTTKYYHSPEFLEEYFRLFDINPIYAKDPKSLWNVLVNIKKPEMNPPQDDELLWDIRTNLELDEDLIAGTLSYLNSQAMPPEEQIKRLRQVHHNTFAEYKKKLSNYKSNSKENERYAKELVSLINDLERIAVNTDIWFFNTFRK